MYKCTRCERKSEYKSKLICPRCSDDVGPRVNESSREVVREVAEEATDFAVTAAVASFISDLLE